VLDEQNAAMVADICRQLDGMPLAIELAAARMNSLSLEQIIARLHDRLHFLTTGSRTAPQRQQTLRATLDWSYELLSESERLVFERLAVFAGGLTLEAAEGIVEGATERRREGETSSTQHSDSPTLFLDTLTHLVDKSLLTFHPAPDEPRYRMLETIRQYALEKLTERGTVADARDCHLDYFCELAERAEPQLQSTGQVMWFNRLESELDNVRAALDWTLAPGDVTGARTTAGLRLAAALLSFWDSRGYPYEGIERLKFLLAQAEQLGLADRACAKALHSLGAMEWGRGRHTEARVHLERALALGHILGDQWIIADALRNLGSVLIAQGEFARGIPLLEQSTAVWQRMGKQGIHGLGWSLTALGGAAMLSGDYARAQTALEEAEQLFARVDNKNYLAYVLRRLSQIALHQNDPARAQQLVRQSLQLNIQVSSQRGIAACVAVMAAVALKQEQPLRAAKFLGAASSLIEQMGERLTPVDQVEFEGTLSQTQARLGGATFDSAFAQGQAQSSDQIIREALAFGESEPPESPRAARRRARTEFGGLTAREREVAALIAQGSSNREIAAALIVGLKTVEAHISHIFSKLGFTSRAQIAAWAVDKELAPPPQVEL
jgi:non-specific serine/threonine protein kinase